MTSEQPAPGHANDCALDALASRGVGASAHALVYEAFQNLSHGRFARLIGATTAYMVQAFALFFTQATRL